jgi:hypothetical protein
MPSPGNYYCNKHAYALSQAFASILGHIAGKFAYSNLQFPTTF